MTNTINEPTEPFNAIGTLRNDLSKLQKEFDNELSGEDSILLDAYKNAFDFNAKYRVDSEWEIELNQDVAHEGWHCDDIHEARRLMSGKKN